MPNGRQLERLRKLKTNQNEPAKTGMAYALAQALIKERLGEAHRRKSKTHRKYCHRITQKAPQLEGSLTKLMDLYESVQYAPRTTGMDRGVEAPALLLEILDLTKNTPPCSKP